MLLAVLGVFGVLRILAGVGDILLGSVLFVLGVLAFLHVRHLLFNRYRVSMAGKSPVMHKIIKKKWVDVKKKMDK